MAQALDPIDYAVISQGLIAIAREMGAKLVRSAHSTILREARDGSAAILDARGQVVSQAELIPMQLGTIGATIAPCLELFPPETLGEGDFLINNDPFAGGQHLQDVYIFTPVHVGGRVVAFTATVAHHLDLGGGSPGINMGSTDIWQEGLIFPPSKWSLDRDWNGGSFERMVRANIRVPAQTIGDFNAQFAANAMGAGRLKDLCAKHGADRVAQGMAALLDYSERRMRSAIERVPDGTYEGEDFIDDDGRGAGPLRIRARLKVAGDRIAVDFDGSAPQVLRNINAPHSSTVSAVYGSLKAVLTGVDVPFNEGLKRPVTVDVPLGSILNPRHPAPVRARMCAANRVYGAVMQALARAVPARVIAPGFDVTTAACLSRLGDKGFSVYIEVFGGGWGASAGRDGADGMDSPLSNCSNTPVEALDGGYDYFRVAEYALLPDSFGRGRRRGGAGFRRRYEILKDGVQLATYGDKFKSAPQGLFGGEPGTPGRCLIVKRDGRRIEADACSAHAVDAGDAVEITVGGGGGYGRPAERAPRDRERDVADGLATRPDPGLAAAAAD